MKHGQAGGAEVIREQVAAAGLALTWGETRATAAACTTLAPPHLIFNSEIKSFFPSVK